MQFFTRGLFYYVTETINLIGLQSNRHERVETANNNGIFLGEGLVCLQAVGAIDNPAQLNKFLNILYPRFGLEASEKFFTDDISKFSPQKMFIFSFFLPLKAFIRIFTYYNLYQSKHTAVVYFSSSPRTLTCPNIVRQSARGCYEEPPTFSGFSCN